MSTDRPSCAIAFTDIVGFTEFTAAHGDEAALQVLDLQGRIVREVLPHESRVVKELGDGLMLWFPDGRTAIDTCLRLRRRFVDARAPLWVRIGLHWGTPHRRGDDYVGHDVNVAARIVDLAGPGELLVSDSLRTVLDDEGQGVRLEELGPVVMKGIPDPVGLFRASQPAEAPS